MASFLGGKTTQQRTYHMAEETIQRKARNWWVAARNVWQLTNIYKKKAQG